MRKKTGFSILILIFLFVSCQKQTSEKTITFDEIKTVKIPIPKNVSNFIPDAIEYHKIDNRDAIIIHYNASNTLLFYDLKTKEIFHSIKLKFIELIKFHYINKDSILLLFSNVNFKNNFYDSTLCMTDYNGLNYKFFDLSHKKIWSSKFGGNIDDAISPDIITLGNTFILDDKFFASFDYYTKKKSPLKDFIGFYDLKKNKWFFYSDFVSRNNLKNKFYPRQYFTANACINTQKNFVFQFGYMFDVFELNTSENEIISHKIQPNLIDSIRFFNHSVPVDVDMTNAKVFSLYYDPLHKWYYSFIQLSLAYKYGVILLVLDKDFNVIAEAYNPGINPYPNIIFKDDTIITWAYKIKEPDSLHIIYLKPVLKKENLDSIKSFIQKNVYDSSLDITREKTCEIYEKDKKQLQTTEQKMSILTNDFNLKDSNFVLVHLFADNGCYHCFEKVMNFFSLNQNVLSKYPCYLMISGENKAQIDFYLTKYALGTFKNLKVDSSNTFDKLLFSSDKNPRIFVKKDSLLSDKIYSPQHTDSIFYKIMSIFGLEQK